ncbi:MAG: tetratricopeptide repeat protein [Eubacterium sp.]|nr:tetratricopeptide repeat protein [Eubacterium sp.]MCM1215267.1 tetratricopeptide repeat protein [Lachnospiraceae bacterium]MCM1303769.1 tetratricopeptide repeat protein [Butyrivibrio sp.]MCM1345249.1 tetratricopeptide repeat protein [Muribaculaceae bacterium]MCM1240250.1 tetratricopeptide repeat protein [Lachnospiraceae bacterium]
MWDMALDSKIIQIEMGNKVIAAYSSSKKRSCDILLSQIGELRAQLAERGIHLPTITLRDSETLPPDMFTIYFGALCINGRRQTDSIPQILAGQACDYQLEDNSYNGLLENFESGVNYLQAKNYQKAIYDFARSYYCSSFRNDTRTIMINSMINICGIQFLNQQYDSALLSGQRAYVLAFSPSFYDPCLKYHAASWMGIIYRRSNNLEEAIRYFELAYRAIAQTDESCLAVSALSTLAQLYMEAKNYGQSAELIDRILDLLQADTSLEVDADFLITLARFQSQVNRAMIRQLTEEYAQLQAQYAKLSARFLPQFKSLALNILYQTGPTVIPCAIGSLMRGSYHIQLGRDNSISEKNTVVISARQS